jgi:predicted GTPase
MRTAKVIIMGAAGRDFHNFNTYYNSNISIITNTNSNTNIIGIRKDNEGTRNNINCKTSAV